MCQSEIWEQLNYEEFVYINIQWLISKPWNKILNSHRMDFLLVARGVHVILCSWGVFKSADILSPFMTDLGSADTEILTSQQTAEQTFTSSVGCDATLNSLMVSQTAFHESFTP